MEISTIAEGDALLAGLRTVNDDNKVAAKIAGAFDHACENLVGDKTGGPDSRLADGILQVEPIGFKNGGLITLTNTIPRTVVRNGENRSADAFGVCFMGVAKADDDLDTWEALAGLEFEDSDRVPNLSEPRLLPTCDSVGDVAPCIVSRSKDRGQTVTVTYVIPTEDPWMR